MNTFSKPDKSERSYNKVSVKFESNLPPFRRKQSTYRSARIPRVFSSRYAAREDEHGTEQRREQRHAAGC